MARKLFETLRAATPPEPGKPPAPAPDAAAIPPEAELPRIRSARSLRGGLMEISANSVRDIDPAAILEDGPRDRLGLDAEGVRALAESIRAHGQQVPILVRPADAPDRYRVVYGRRRLAAARLLGMPVKALVRTLDDPASVVAQGQENSLRLNPSFIEKAVFVGALRAAGYESGTIQDALGISRQALSLLTIAQQSIPLAVIEAIGPAHEIGRRRWMELADLARGEGVDLGEVLARCADELARTGSSEARFNVVFKAATTRPPSPAPRRTLRSLGAADGAELGRLRASGAELVLSFPTKDHPEFAAWLERNAESLVRDWYSQWRSEKAPDE